MRKTILVVVILALAGGGWYAYSEYNKKDEPPTITTAKVTRGDVAEMVGATGTLQAVTTVQDATRSSNASRCRGRRTAGTPFVEERDRCEPIRCVGRLWQ